jgi:hypothetical protein
MYCRVPRGQVGSDSSQFVDITALWMKRDSFLIETSYLKARFTRSSESQSL